MHGQSRSRPRRLVQRPSRLEGGRKRLAEILTRWATARLEVRQSLNPLLEATNVTKSIAFERSKKKRTLAPGQEQKATNPRAPTTS